MLIIIGIVLLVALGVGIGLFFKAKVSSIPDGHDLAQSLDAEVNKLFKVQDSHAVVIGVFKDGRVYSKAYGVVEKGEKLKPNAQTVFQIASITKVFTVSLLLELVDKGVVSLNSTLGELLGDSVPMNNKAAQITLEQLATHTSGLPRIPKPMLREIEERAGKENVMVDPYSYLGRDYMFAYLENAKVKSPGKFAYSNYGMGMLAHVLERKTDKTYEELVSDEVLAPMRMFSTGISVTPKIEERFAQGYTAKGETAGLWTSKALGGAGALYSTMDDMLQFVQQSLEIGTPASNRFEKMRLAEYSGGQALGWMHPGVIEKIHGNRNSVWHNGMVGGYSSYLSIDPVNRSGVVVLTSRAIDATLFGVLLTRQVRTQSWADE